MGNFDDLQINSSLNDLNYEIVSNKIVGKNKSQTVKKDMTKKY